MERKELTKLLLADTLKELMAAHDFEKITIKMITGAAGVIRPTFYNHFQDKYEVLEWIADTDIIAPMRALMEQGRFRDALSRLFVTIYDGTPFYRRAFAVTGQNGFSEMLIRKLGVLLLEYMEAHGYRVVSENPLLTPVMIAGKYALDVVTVLAVLITTEFLPVSPDELLDAYIELIDKPISEIIKKAPEGNS